MRRLLLVYLGSSFVVAAAHVAADGPAQDAADAYTACLTARATDSGNRSASTGKVDPDAVKADCVEQRAELSEMLSPDMQVRVFDTLDANIPKQVEEIAEAAGK